ncbi:hypothetical protein [Sphingomonas rubra]|uniref:Uncharacterized protein n=1 Tax=Sphingomonas rubra TaxID=634430 RepID=A0A1I5UU95_9SPHN|nr:hypothetical protein [Sphingomonas rubra]SFP98792.1 hypothetical protein SAMN04488241_11622 [Sphingomonas rubra]
MATQLQHADFPMTPLPASTWGRAPGQPVRPNIRIAFSASPAVLAVRDKAADTPDAVKTLDEIAATHVPFRALLAERNALVDHLDSQATSPDEARDTILCSAINNVENLILGGVSHTPDDTIVRLIALAQVAAEGHEVDDVTAARGIKDAQRHFGIGYLHEGLRDEQPLGATSAASATAWQSAYDLYCIKRAERRSHEAAVVKPAYARYEAVRAQWPADLVISGNPEAQAALDAVDYDAAEDRFDELVMIEHAALMSLLLTPVPGASELATKLSIFVAEEGWDFKSAEANLIMRDDARRLAGHGAVQQDAALLAAFKARRAESAFWLDNGTTPVTDQIEERSNEIVRDAEAMLFGTQATSIEGVIAKLRALFPYFSQQPYSERAPVDPSHSGFREGLKEDGGNEQVLWACIEDLARISGVNLAEQGA